MRKLFAFGLAAALLAVGLVSAEARAPSAGVTVYGTDMLGLVDEGGYFCVGNAQTGIATGATPTAFSDTNPFVAIFNKEAIGGKSIYLDFVTLVATAAGTAGTALEVATQVDLNGDRYTSGGSDLTANIVNPNGNAGGSSVAKFRAGNITAAAKTTSARQVTGQRILKTAIPAINDTYTMKFGGVDSITSSGPTAAVTWTTINLPKLVVPPQGSALIHLWLPSQSGASSYIPEACWAER